MDGEFVAFASIRKNFGQEFLEYLRSGQWNKNILLFTLYARCNFPKNLLTPESYDIKKSGMKFFHVRFLLKNNLNFRSHALFAAQKNLRVMLCNDVLYNGEPQTCSAS